jgi:DNA-binding SARP family transcriptional activator
MFNKNSARPSLRVHLLGPFRVIANGKVVEEDSWSRRKPRLLVKLLALQPHHQLHREQVMELLWPELSAESAANSLHKAIHLARHALEPGLKAGSDSSFILTRGQQITLSAPGGLWIDAEEFEKRAYEAAQSRDAAIFEAALELYEGDLLMEDLYEDWAASSREQLRGLRLDLLIKLAGLYESQGQYAKGIDRLNQVVMDDTSNEEAHMRLMRLYALSGSRHQALRQYRICSEAIRKELDAEPDQATTDLYGQILSGEIQPAGSSSASSERVGSFHLPSPNPSARMVNRAKEMEQVSALLNQAIEGKGALLLIGGEAGAGKTRLATEALERARQKGTLLLAGACYEQEGRLPYGPFAEAFGRYARSQSKDALAELLRELTAPFAKLVPAMAFELGCVGAADELPHDKKWLFAAAAGFLARLAENSPVALLLDDLHAADEDSLAMLHHLARAAGSMRLLIVGTFREEDAGPASPLARLLASLYRERLATSISLSLLSQEDSRELIYELIGGEVDAEMADYVYDVAAGNPFFTEEIARAMLEQGQVERGSGRWLASPEVTASLPSGLRDWVRVRLERAGEDGQRVISCAAVIGREAAFELLLEVSSLAEADLLDVTDRLTVARIFEPTAVGFRFHHPLAREIVYDRLSPLRRSQLHSRVAAAIERLYANQIEGQIETLAHHYSLSRELEKAIHYLVLAGDRAASVYANDLALSDYRAAMAMSCKAGTVNDPITLASIHERIGDVESRTGSTSAASESYLEAISAASEAPLSLNEKPEIIARLPRKAAYQLILQSRLDEAEEQLRAAKEALEEARLGDHVEMARLHYTSAHLHWHREQFADALASAQQSLNIAEKIGSRADVMLAYEALALTSLPLGDWRRGLEYECLRQSLYDLNRDIAAISDVHL